MCGNLQWRERDALIEESSSPVSLHIVFKQTNFVIPGENACAFLCAGATLPEHNAHAFEGRGPRGRGRSARCRRPQAIHHKRTEAQHPGFAQYAAAMRPLATRFGGGIASSETAVARRSARNDNRVPSRRCFASALACLREAEASLRRRQAGNDNRGLKVDRPMSELPGGSGPEFPRTLTRPTPCSRFGTACRSR